MQKIYFTKMHGAGNDFIFVDYKLNPGFEISADKIRRLCHRRFGIGADGVITISDSNDHNYKMGYYNADGSTGSLCANGARCSIWFAEKSGRLKNGFARFISNGNDYSGEVISDEFVKFYLNQPSEIKTGCSLTTTGIVFNYNFINTGSPHAVIRISEVMNSDQDKNWKQDLKTFPVFELGRKIRYHSDFGVAGTNVNFIDIINNEILIRTYERGVEDETLACGTGSVASALIGFLKYNLEPPITLITYGGDKLLVNFSFENEEYKNLSLTGPAKIAFEGTVEEKFFL